MGIVHRQIIIKFLASGFYAGYSPLAPGTAGSLVGVLIYLLLQNLSNITYIAFIILIFIAGIFIAGEAENIYQKKDSPYIVIDEIAGMLITFLFFPIGPIGPKGLIFLLSGFITFRIFDILKPFPVRLMERRLAGGWGVMCDDIMAGVYANLVIRGVDKFIL